MLDFTSSMWMRRMFSPQTSKVTFETVHARVFPTQYQTPLFNLHQVPAVEFTDKLSDVKAVETEDAVFQCVLSTPLSSITWSREDVSLESGHKYEISVSEDKLTHTLRVKDCEVADAGRYYAIAGLTSSSASLSVKGKIKNKKWVCRE